MCEVRTRPAPPCTPHKVEANLIRKHCANCIEVAGIEPFHVWLNRLTICLVHHRRPVNRNLERTPEKPDPSAVQGALDLRNAPIEKLGNILEGIIQNIFQYDATPPRCREFHEGRHGERESPFSLTRHVRIVGHLDFLGMDDALPAFTSEKTDRLVASCPRSRRIRQVPRFGVQFRAPRTISARRRRSETRGGINDLPKLIRK